MTYLKIYCAILAVLAGLFVAAVVDSRFRGFPEITLKQLERISPLLPSADPGMNNSARYVRHLGLATPASAFPDFPGQPDYLPSGMAWGPPGFVGLHRNRSITGEKFHSSDGLP